MRLWTCAMVALLTGAPYCHADGGGDSIGAGAPFDGFDVLRIVRAIQAQVEEVIGQNLPDLAEMLVNFDGEQVAEQLRQYKVDSIIDAVLDYTRSVDMPTVFQAIKDVDKALVMQKYIIPRGQRLFTFMENFNGKDLVAWIKTLRGDSSIEAIKTLDLKPYAQEIEDFNIVPIVQALLRYDATPWIEYFRSFNGSTFLKTMEMYGGERILTLLRETSVRDYLEGFGVDLDPYDEQVRRITGGLLFSYIGGLSGEQFIEDLENLDGRAFVAMVNTEVNRYMSAFRQAATHILFKAQAEPYDRFDLVTFLNGIRTYAKDTQALPLPDLVALIENIDGPRYVKYMEEMDLNDYLYVMYRLFKIFDLFSLSEALYNVDMEVFFHSYVLPVGLAYFMGEQNDIGMRVFSAILNYNGTRALEYIRTARPDRIIKVVNDLNIVGLVNALTGVDITPLIQTIGNYNGTLYLETLANFQGERTLEMLEEIGMKDYLDGFKGMDFSGLYQYLRATDGKYIKQVLLEFDGPAFVERITKLKGTEAVQSSNEYINSVLTEFRSRALAFQQHGGAKGMRPVVLGGGQEGEAEAEGVCLDPDGKCE